VAQVPSPTYGGTTTISNGTLQIGNGGTSGTLGLGLITDNSVLAFDRSDSIMLPTGITGFGSVSQMGSGTLTFFTAQSYSGTTSIANGSTVAVTGFGTITSSIGVIDNGTLDISAITPGSLTVQSLVGSGTVDLGSKLLIISAADGIFSGNAIGTGAGINVTGGTLMLTGSTNAGVSIGSGAILQLGTGGASGSIGGTGAIADSGSLVFNHSDTVVFANPIVGSGSLTQTGTGTLILSVSNSYSGPTAIAQGTLALGAAGGLAIENSSAVLDDGVFDISGSALSNVTIQSLSGSGTVNLGSTSLTIEGTGNFAGTFTGGGGITLNSGGTEIFGGNNAFSGPINSGERRCHKQRCAGVRPQRQCDCLQPHFRQRYSDADG
jgi:autotransporter-associated beta strand protein